MKKRMGLVMALLCAAMAAGCQKTPEAEIVRQKGEDSVASYQEAEEESGENSLSKRLQVPERYQLEDGDSEEGYSLSADASISVPDVEKIGIYKVKLKDYTPELMMKVHQAFFGDAVIYEGNQYFQMTKEEIQEKLEELKAYQAAGNLDPYGILENFAQQGKDEDIDPDEIYSLQREIDGWEEEYQNAPENKEKVPVTPQFGLSVEGMDEEWTKDRFLGAVETEDGVFSCDYARNHAAAKIYIRFTKVREDGQGNSHTWNNNSYDAYEEGQDRDKKPSREEAEKMAGISQEEAIRMGDDYVEKLGDEGWKLAACRLSIHQQVSDTNMTGNDSSVIYDDGGYCLYYTRAIDGFPTTYETNPGGGLESMDSTNDAVNYESFSMVINQEGLQYMEMDNWYDVVEQQVENVQMKSFPEIAEIFEQMMKMKNADMEDYVTKKSYQIREVRLGYTRIYDPGADVNQGILVPVWDFFGVWKTSYRDETTGENVEYITADPYQSYMTINAIDGTVVDRSLGY